MHWRRPTPLSLCLLGLLCWHAQAPATVPLRRDAFLAASKRSGREPQALLARGLPVEVLGEEEEGWVPVRIEGRVPAAALAAPELDSHAEALFRLARVAQEERWPAGRIFLEDIRTLRITPVQASGRGGAVRIRFTVQVSNRTGMDLEGLQVELSLLNRAQNAITQVTGRMSAPRVLKNGQEGAFEVAVNLTEGQYKAFSKRRLRARYFVD